MLEHGDVAVRVRPPQFGIEPETVYVPCAFLDRRQLDDRYLHAVVGSDEIVGLESHLGYAGGDPVGLLAVPSRRDLVAPGQIDPHVVCQGLSEVLDDIEEATAAPIVFQSSLDPGERLRPRMASFPLALLAQDVHEEGDPYDAYSGGHYE